VHKASLAADVERWNRYDTASSYKQGVISPNRISDEEEQRYIDLIMNVDSSSSLTASPVEMFFWEHFEPYFGDKISYETAIERLRNQLTLYVSE
jgi:hypothetical protein